MLHVMWMIIVSYPVSLTLRSSEFKLGDLLVGFVLTSCIRKVVLERAL